MRLARLSLLSLVSLALASLALAPWGVAHAQPATAEPPAESTVPPSGVIHPPAHVDPGIAHKPMVGAPGQAPTVDPMPIVPPPGTPGGNPNVIPK